VISILKKQRQDIVDYKMTISGEREKGKEPSLWQTIHVKFQLYGDIDPDKASRAVDLSINKYCSVAATLMAAGAKISTQVVVHPAI
jgi:putative redox protein